MRPLLAVLLATFLLPVSIASAQTTPARARPNFVFILTDDQRWDCLGCAGHPFLKTPNIDRIAREGAYFNNYFVTLPLCSPSRGSILTGQYAHKNGVIDNVTDHSALSHQLVTFPRLLHDAGYTTAHIGKWHMGNDATPRPGYDRWVCIPGQGRYIDPILNVDGKQGPVPGYVTDLLSNYAADFIRTAPKDKPFCLYLGHKSVHQPCTPAQRHKDLYSTEPLPQRPNVKDDDSGKPAIMREVPDAPKGHPDRGVPEKQIRDMLRCIQSIDDGVGEIYKALEDAGRLDNTVIIYTSDNGYLFNEHQLGDKRAAYEESIRDPLLVRYPGVIQPGTKVDGITLNVDVAPTLLDLAGAKIPSNMDGRSWAPLFRGDVKDWRKSALFEYVWEKQYPRVPTWQAVRTDRWKFIHYDGVQDMDELYDLTADPYEMKNLIHDDAQQAQLKELQDELRRLIEATK